MSDDLTSKSKAFDDLNLEIAGQDVGRGARFMPESRGSRTIDQQKKDEAASTRRMLTALQEALLDPDYAAAWNRANDALNDLQDRITTLSDELAQRIEHLEDVIDDLEENTATTADGSLVFRDAEGRLVDENGVPLSPEDAAKVSNPDDAQSYDQYRNAQDALRKAREKQDRYSDIQRDITRWKDQITDPENPPSKDDLDQIIDQLDKANAEIDSMTKASPEFEGHSSPPLAEPSIDSDFKIEMPSF